MKRKYTLIVLILLFNRSLAQDVPLFQSREPINLKITGSVKSIKKNSNDSTFVTGKFLYQKDNEWVTVPAEARVRGNFRLNNCYFPPLKLKFKKKDVESTIFSGNKTVKLVVPCETSKEKNSLIRREYLCYKIYETVSSYYFRTRLANIELTEVSQNKPRTYKLLSFFVEDNSIVAKRSQGKVIKSRAISPAAFDEKQSLRNDYFQYMIGNADWSAVFQHNSNTLYVGGKYVPLSYDFDLSGFVNAPYAQVSPAQGGKAHPRAREYRGFCKSRTAMEEIRKEFLEKESAVIKIIENESSNFSKFDLNEMKVYVNEFYEILKSDHKFGASIIAQCRTK
jgi:hypothetical protein